LADELAAEHPRLERAALEVESLWPRLIVLTSPAPWEVKDRVAVCQMLGAELVRRFPRQSFLIVHYGDHQPTATQSLLGFDENVSIEDIVASASETVNRTAASAASAPAKAPAKKAPAKIAQPKADAPAAEEAAAKPAKKAPAKKAAAKKTDEGDKPAAKKAPAKKAAPKADKE